jgi:non-ribosomal peptide synthetase component E (peptide arylation enzyme)
MAVFKTPEKVERLAQLPLLGSGKADRAALRRRAAAS